MTDFDAVLTAHESWSRPGSRSGQPLPKATCTCGEEFDAATTYHTVDPGHRAHVVAMLNAAVAEAASEPSTRPPSSSPHTVW